MFNYSSTYYISTSIKYDIGLVAYITNLVKQIILIKKVIFIVLKNSKKTYIIYMYII